MNKEIKKQAIVAESIFSSNSKNYLSFDFAKIDGLGNWQRIIKLYLLKKINA